MTQRKIMNEKNMYCLKKMVIPCVNDAFNYVNDASFEARLCGKFNHEGHTSQIIGFTSMC